jgi:hypothetical protein
MNAIAILSVLNLAKAFWGLSAAMLPMLLRIGAMLLPFAEILIAVGSLAVAGYQLYRHWDYIALWWKHLWGGMSDDAYNSAKKILDAKNSLNPGGNTATSSMGSPTDSILETIRKTENSGDSAVSRAGAIGRYQVLPSTAKWLGYDPAKLYNPAYNKTVAAAYVNYLQNRFHGNTAGIIAAYNAGPGSPGGRIDKFLASGDPSGLPGETQKYLTRANGFMGQPGPAVETPYSVQTPYKINPNMAQGGAGSGGGGAVTVLISFENAPKGMKTKTHTSGGIIANTKIRYAMPDFGAAT